MYCFYCIIMIFIEYEMNKMKVLFMNYLFFVKGGVDLNNFVGFFFYFSLCYLLVDIF